MHFVDIDCNYVFFPLSRRRAYRVSHDIRILLPGITCPLLPGITFMPTGMLLWAIIPIFDRYYIGMIYDSELKDFFLVVYCVAELSLNNIDVGKTVGLSIHGNTTQPWMDHGKALPARVKCGIYTYKRSNMAYFRH